MIRLVRPLAAVALLSSAVPAAAFVRETTARGQPGAGLCLWWRARQVTYRVNATTAAPARAATHVPCGSAAVAETAAAAGLATWASATRPGGGSACTDFTFVQGAPTTQTATGDDGVNLVVFRTSRCDDVVGLDPCAGVEGACAAKFNCWEHPIGIIGLTTTSRNLDTGEIFDADMELFGWDGQPQPLGSYFTCEGPGAPACSTYGEAGCNEVDVQAVVTHEAGHMLGLDHVCSSLFPPPYNACPSGAEVMVPTVGAVAQRTLAPDDVEGVCTIYPKGASTLTCLSGGVPPEKKPESGGCSSAGGTGWSALVAMSLAALSVRQRRRRSDRR
jgi:uncharacterized protein (TIGR03382 family)